jgi:hypothetical protein
MKRSCFAVITLAFASFAGNALAMSPGCHCSPCTCSPCHCGGGYHSRGGVGVGIDLSGLLNRRSESTQTVIINDPNQSVSHSEPKTKTKKTDKTTTTSNPFRDVKLTGDKAKEVALADGSFRSPTDQSGVNLNGTVGGLILSQPKKTKP